MDCTAAFEMDVADGALGVSSSLTGSRVAPVAADAAVCVGVAACLGAILGEVRRKDEAGAGE
eukprot:3896239-Pleurochrysis_carterae.AAC.1